MTFSADLTRFCKDIAPDYVEKVVRRTVIEIGNRAVMRSPVGDADYWIRPAPPGYAGGRFRGNWQYGFNSAPASDLARIDPSGGETIGGIVTGALTSPGVGMHFVVNNLPYAQRLEDGWSRQAPQGIVSRIALEFEDIVERAKRA